MQTGGLLLAKIKYFHNTMKRKVAAGLSSLNTCRIRIISLCIYSRLNGNIELLMHVFIL